MPALSSWGPLLGAALLGGVIGGVTSRLLPPRFEKPGPRSSAVVRTEGAEPDPGRLAELERRIGALERRRTASEAVAAYGQALASDQARGRGADGAAPAVAAENPAFELAVRSVLERIDEERDLERDSERAERRQRRVTEAVAAMSKELALSADQRTRVEQVMRDHQAQLGKLRDPRAPDRPANREERRRQMQALSAQTDTKLATILDANQLTRFRERRSEMLGTGRQRGPE